tara:strand:- start:59 stop:685 length:627 start_codon:yes stop_codon:yes gene_type:complete
MRLKKLRKMTQLSRKDFCDKYNMSSGTLQNWETARFGGLTEKGARLIITFLKQENIICSFEWLMFQAGQPPKLTHTSHPPSQNKPAPQGSDIIHEINYFYKLHATSFHTVIQDDSMEPVFKKGWTVCGEKYDRSVWYKVTHQDCIVQLTNRDPIVRHVRPTQQDTRTLELIALNPYSNCAFKQVITDQIDFIAPIIWTRHNWQPNHDV